MLSLMVVPDYLPDQFSTWYLLNNYLQKKSDQNISLLMPPSFDEVKAQQDKEKVSMLFVNPFAAGSYVREQGYLPLVKPKNKPDEIVIHLLQVVMFVSRDIYHWLNLKINLMKSLLLLLQIQILTLLKG